MEDDKTPIMIKEVLIEEFYSKDDNGVYRNWRIANYKPEWTKEFTPFNEIPWVKFPNIDLKDFWKKD